MDLVDGARESYLERLDRALSDSDWALCWYCLMGNHGHLGLVSGEAPLQSWAGRVHSGWASWINRSGRRRGQHCRGPILAERPTSLFLPDHRAPLLGAYIHNNPVRAGLVDSAAESTWSSHRAYLGTAPPLAALDIDRGLALFGCDASPEGRQRFDGFVASRAGTPRDRDLSGGTACQAAADARRQLGPTVEVSTPIVHDKGALYPAACRPHAHMPTRYLGTPGAFLAELACAVRVPVEAIRAPGQRRFQTGARRLAVLIWRSLGRPTVEMAAALNISPSSATNLVLRATPRDLASARLVEQRIVGCPRGVEMRES